jgi:tetratricopeptide repeat protein 8
MASKCFQVAVNYLSEHAEALNNLAVLEARKGNIDLAITLSEKSFKFSGVFECAYNLSIWYYRQNNIKSAKLYNGEALKIYRQHAESLQLRNRLDQMLNL